jgi:Bromodomain
MMRLGLCLDVAVCGSDADMGVGPGKAEPAKALEQDVGPAASKQELAAAQRAVTLTLGSDAGSHFAEPVDEDDVPGYYDIIKEPMDLGLISRRLKERKYTSLGAFSRPVLLLLRTAASHLSGASELCVYVFACSPLLGVGAVVWEGLLGASVLCADCFHMKTVPCLVLTIPHLIVTVCFMCEVLVVPLLAMLTVHPSVEVFCEGSDARSPASDMPSPPTLVGVLHMGN